MPSKLSLNTCVHVVSKSRAKEIVTIRELLTRSSGSAFEAIQMLDDYDRLCEEYDAEISAKYDKKYYLPFGSHLLPQDYQNFICKWNKMMTEKSGWWNGQFRNDFKVDYPNLWAEFKVENKKFMQLYPAEVAAVKAYQADYVDEDSSMEDFPPLPSSPVAEPACGAVPRCCITPCAEGLCCDHCWVLREDDLPSEPVAEPVPEPVAEPVPEPVAVAVAAPVPEPVAMAEPVPVAAPVPEAVDAIEMVPELASLVANSEPLPSSNTGSCGCCPGTASLCRSEYSLQSDWHGLGRVVLPKNQPPKAPTKYRPPYNDYRWPSPLPKVFVQHIRGRNAWDNCKYWRRYGGVWSADFKVSWLLAGNTEFKLTHENCLRYLAYRCNCSVAEFMNKKPAEVNAKFFSAYSGVKGHYFNRY